MCSDAGISPKLDHATCARCQCHCTCVVVQRHCIKFVDRYLHFSWFLQGLEHALEAQQTLAAFQAFVEAKDWLHAAESLAHAAALSSGDGAVLPRRPRCVHSLQDNVASCKEQLRVELVYVMREAAQPLCMTDVMEACASRLKVCTILQTLQLSGSTLISHVSIASQSIMHLRGHDMSLLWRQVTVCSRCRQHRAAPKACRQGSSQTILTACLQHVQRLVLAHHQFQGVMARSLLSGSCSKPPCGLPSYLRSPWMCFQSA